MNKGILIGVLMVAGIAAGGAFLSLNSDDAGDSSSATVDKDADQAQLNDEATIEQDSEFGNLFGADLSSLNEDIRVDLVGPDFVGYIEIGTGKDLRVNVTADGVESEFVQVGDSAYFKDTGSGQWYAYDLGLDTVTGAFTSGVDSDEFESYAPEDIVSNGVVDCSSGSCRSYSVTEEGETSTLLVDNATNRISEWRGVDSDTGEPVVFTYTYDADISIEAPDNVQKFGL